MTSGKARPLRTHADDDALREPPVRTSSRQRVGTGKARRT